MPRKDIFVPLRPTLRSQVAVVGEVSRDWLEDVGGRDSIVVF